MGSTCLKPAGFAGRALKALPLHVNKGHYMFIHVRLVIRNERQHPVTLRCPKPYEANGPTCFVCDPIPIVIDTLSP